MLEHATGKIQKRSLTDEGVTILMRSANLVTTSAAATRSGVVTSLWTL
jgi:hypothetical protein